MLDITLKLLTIKDSCYKDKLILRHITFTILIITILLIMITFSYYFISLLSRPFILPPGYFILLYVGTSNTDLHSTS